MSNVEEAIEKLEYYLQNSAYKKVDSDSFENNWELVNLEIPQAIETVLNMLKNMEKQKENYKSLIADVSMIAKELGLEEDGTIDEIYERIKQNSAELAEKSAEIEKYKSLYNKALEDLVKADRKNIQLKKQIDLMAETIRKLAISLASYEGSYNKETINFTGNIKNIKQYFKQKATNNG